MRNKWLGRVKFLWVLSMVAIIAMIIVMAISAFDDDLVTVVYAGFIIITLLMFDAIDILRDIRRNSTIELYSRFEQRGDSYISNWPEE